MGTIQRITLSVPQMYRQTVQTEVEFEVDHDATALEQLFCRNKQLADCFEWWLRRELETSREFILKQSEQLRRIALRKGVSYETPNVVRDTVQVSPIREPGINLNAILAELNDSRRCPQRCCRLSRGLRYEVVCLYIRGRLVDHRTDLVDGIRLLREIVFDFRGTAGIAAKYVANIELRLGYIEGIYQQAFSEEIDSADETRWAGAEAAQRMTRYLGYIEEDIRDVQSQVNGFQVGERCISDTLDVVRGLHANQSEVRETMAGTLDACRTLSPTLENLDGALRDLEAAMNGVSTLTGPRVSNSSH